MSRYCEICSSVLSEKTSTGTLLFECRLCRFTRHAAPEETLRIEISLNQESEIVFNSKEDLINDETVLRVPINCECGSKIGVLRTVGHDCEIIKICYFCMKDIIN